MFYHKDGFPEENELVLCTVTSVQYNSVFCTLDLYNKSGMIHISEVSPGRIRNIRDYVVEGKKVICKVLRITEEKGHIDLSLRRVNESQKREMNAFLKQEQKAENIIEKMATDLKLKPAELYAAIATPILEEYEYVHMAFQEHVDGEADLAKMDIPEAYVASLIERVVEKIKPMSVSISGKLSLSTFAADGIERIRAALLAGEAVDKEVEISYLGSGTYKIVVTAEEYKDAEEILKKVLATIEDSMKGADGTAVAFARA